ERGSREAETAMEGRIIRVDQRSLGQEQKNPCREHNAVDAAHRGERRRYVENVLQIEGWREAREDDERAQHREGEKESAFASCDIFRCYSRPKRDGRDRCFSHAPTP